MKSLFLRERTANFLAYPLDVSEVELSIAKAWCAHTEKRKIGRKHRLFGSGSGAQKTVRGRLGDQLRNARLYDWASAGVQRLRFGGV